MSEADNKSPDATTSADEGRALSMRRDIDDVNIWAVVKFAIGILILGIFSYIMLYGMLKLFEHQQQASRGPAPPMARGDQDRLPPPPRLQMMPGSPSEYKSPEYEMTLMREEEEKRLTTYGWVNRDAGIVRIPIDEAMKRVLEKGLPSKPASATPAESPSPPAAAAATSSGAG
jgi:hypothetical protein